MTRARAAGVVLLALAALACAAAPAGATEVTADELRSLAGRAAEDPVALAELRRVDSVDGRPVDVRGALRGARGAELEGRLATLEDSVAEPVPGSRDPRADARAVLSEQRFKAPGTGPLRGLLERLGKLVPSLDWLDDLLPGGRSVVWIILGTVFGVIAAIVARATLTRRVQVASARKAAVEASEDPRALERRADAAEAAGDLQAALRLRFRAGLLRLDQRGTIVFRPSISTGEVRRAVRSEDFEALATTFDDVVYGGRPAQPDDVSAARERWPEVVKGSR